MLLKLEHQASNQGVGGSRAEERTIYSKERSSSCHKNRSIELLASTLGIPVWP